MTFLANSEQTKGAFSMTEYLSKPGNEPPAPVHVMLTLARGLVEQHPSNSYEIYIRTSPLKMAVKSR
jgi:hypothetical protein